MRSEIPYGYVYKITNKINGKSYVGMRKLSLDKRWRQYLGSGKLLQQAVKKYGEGNFIKELVCYAYTLEELQEIEWKKIKYFKSLDQAEYNLFTGKGAGGDTFALLAGDRKEEVLRRQTEGIRRVASEMSLRAIEKREVRYKEFVSNHSDAILKTYEELRHIKRTSLTLGLNLKFTHRFLKESNVELNYQMGKKTKEQIEGKKLYYDNLLGADRHIQICIICSIKFKSSIRKTCSDECLTESKRERMRNNSLAPIFTSSYEELYQLWIIEDKSISELMEVFGCKQRTVYYLLEENGLPTRKYDARNIRDELFPKSLRSCDFCEGDIPKQYKGSTCSHKCRVNKFHRDKLLAQ